MLNYITTPDGRVVDQRGQVRKLDAVGFRMGLPADKRTGEGDKRGGSRKP